MLNLIRKIFAPPLFEGDEDKTISAELLNLILTTAYPLLILIFVGLIAGGASPAMFLIVAAFSILLVALQVPMRRGYIKQVSVTLVLLITLTLTTAIALDGTVRVPSVAFYILASVISGLLISSQAAYWSAALNSIIVFLLIWAENTGKLRQSDYIVNAQQGIVFAAASIFTVVLLSLALKRLNQALVRARREKELSILNIDLEQRVEERTSELQATSEELQIRATQLEAIAEISQAIALVQNLETLLPEITKRISERFDFYHVGIFLISKNGKFAELKATNSIGGNRMLARKHQLEIGRIGIVGRVAQDGQPRIALDVGQDAVYFDNPDLPETRSEVALPLKIGNEIIGVLDVQSKRKGIFSQEDVKILSTLANQVAIAIENARQTEITQTALEEARAVSRQYIHQAWTQLAATQRQQGYRYAEEHLSPLSQKEKGEHSKDNEDVFSVPVLVHDEKIGTLKIHKSESMKTLGAEDMELIQAVANRAALALENARLLEETSRRAGREHLVSEITTKIRSTNDPQAMIQTALDELKEALSASKIEIMPQKPKVNEMENVEES